MNRRDDFPYEMLGRWLDRDAADRILAGRLHPDDAPPGFDGVARLMEALNAPVTGVELAGERRAVVAAVRVLNDAAPSPAEVRRWKMRSRLSRAKLAGLVVVGTLIGTTGMAAANVLPDPAQNAVSQALSHVGVTLPSAAPRTGPVEPTTVDHPAATGQEISQLATTTDATGADKGAEISAAASGGMSQAGQHGGGAPSGDASSNADHASDGGTGIADGASGGTDQTGSTTADDASGGRSDQGSGNRPSAPPTP
jgi:hypothetical protein